MPGTSVCSYTPPSRSFTYVEAHTPQEKKRFVLDETNKVLYLLKEASNAVGTEFKLHRMTEKDIKKMGISFVDRIIHCSTDMTKPPIWPTP